MILDTNVFSAIMKLTDNPVIQKWLASNNPSRLSITAITVFEVRFGIEKSPAGRKRTALEESFEQLMKDFAAKPDRILALDTGAANHAGRIQAKRHKAGINIELPDTMIGAIAVSRGLPLVTRNVRHFDDLPVTLINPWA